MNYNYDRTAAQDKADVDIFERALKALEPLEEGRISEQNAKFLKYNLARKDLGPFNGSVRTLRELLKKLVKLAKERNAQG